jgi:hypothetical protein
VFPKRPGPYLIAFLLILLIVLAVWLFQALTSDVVIQAVQKKQAERPRPVTQDPIPTPMPTNPSIPRLAPGSIDPALQAQADGLHNLQEPPERDLEIVADFISTYSKGIGGNPIGDNADITAALTGTQGHKGRVFPQNHRAIRNGQLIDRWGTPFWFHPNSGNQMEIRSAGQDKEMFTADDLVQNPSPSGLGVTPQSGG